MAKRRSFEDQFETELRWPRAGDQAFVASENGLENALIVENAQSRLILMLEGYKKAGDLMIEQTVENPGDRDFLVFPVIFNYRQFIELSLKYLIASYGPTVGVNQNWHSHNLIKLWELFLIVLEGYGTNDPDEVDPVVQGIVVEFSKIDPGSYSYRYPVDRHGNPIPVAQTSLHLPTLKDVISGVAGYFTGCDGYFDSLKSA